MVVILECLLLQGFCCISWF